MKNDLIERQAVIDAFWYLDVEIDPSAIAAILEMLKSVPSAQPELNFDEWCTDCKEYDHERHCCPRFNRVIRNALKDAQLEIVRCKDCKHHHYEKDIPYCDRIDYGYGWKNNDYCSRAERRTDE